MKRTLSVLTAVLFAGALAAPVMAQSAPTDQKVAQAAGGTTEKPAEAPAAEPTAKPKHKHHKGHKKPKGEASPAAAASPAAGAEH